MKGGTSITLTGENLLNGIVWFGSKRAAIISNSASRVIITAPSQSFEADTTISVKISVDGVDSNPLSFLYTLCQLIHSGDTIALTALHGGSIAYNVTIDQNGNVIAYKNAFDPLTVLNTAQKGSLLTWDMLGLMISRAVPFAAWKDTANKRTVLNCASTGAAVKTIQTAISATTSASTWGFDLRPRGAIIDSTGAKRLCHGDTFSLYQGSLQSAIFIDLSNQRVADGPSSFGQGYTVYCDTANSKSRWNPKPVPTVFTIKRVV